MGSPAYRPGLRAIRIGLHGFIEIGSGFLGLVDGEVTGRARQQRLGPLRRQAVGRGEIRDRLLVLLVGLINQPAAIQRRHVVGVEWERAVELGQRLFGLAGLGERLAARSVALGVAGALSADRAGRLLLGGLRLLLVRSPRS